MSDTKQPKVSTGNVFFFSNGGCQFKQILSQRVALPCFCPANFIQVLSWLCICEFLKK